VTVNKEIARLYLLYRFPRNGLGHLLMNEVLAVARKIRVDGLFLNVEKADQNAIDFYSDNGFRVLQSARRIFGSGKILVLGSSGSCAQ